MDKGKQRMDLGQILTFGIMILGLGLIVSGNSLGQLLTFVVGWIVLALGLGLAYSFGKQEKKKDV